MTLKENVIAAAEYAYKEHYSKPYTYWQGTYGTVGRKAMRAKVKELYGVDDKFASFYKPTWSVRCDGVARPNHATPHALRQACYLEHLIDFLRKYCSSKKWVINGLDIVDSDPNFLSKLQIAAIFYSAGRRDEMSNNTEFEYLRKAIAADPTGDYSDPKFRKGLLRTSNKTDCAEFFEIYCRQYAKDLFSEDDIKTFKTVLGHYSGSLGRGKAKESFILDLLRKAHLLDLVRCWRGNRANWYLKEVSKLENYANDYPEKNDVKHATLELMSYAMKLCVASGDRLSEGVKSLLGVTTKDAAYKAKGRGCRFSSQYVELANDVSKCVSELDKIEYKLQPGELKQEDKKIPVNLSSWLLKFGFDANNLNKTSSITNPRGHTPLTYALRTQDNKILSLLLEFGADPVATRNKVGWKVTALEWVARWGSVEQFNIVYAKKLNKDSLKTCSNRWSWTPFMWAQYQRNNPLKQCIADIDPDLAVTKKATSCKI